MAFKINISDTKGRSWKMECESESLNGKSVGDVLEGKEISADLTGYSFEITGGSDQAGFPLSKDVEGLGLGKLLLKKGWGMRANKPHGLRLRKTVRGKVISPAVSQINLKIAKEGGRKLEEVFPDQNKGKEKKAEALKAEEASAA